jgi:hypothetical protein
LQKSSRYLCWGELADLIISDLNGAIGSKRVTYVFARLVDCAKEIKCSEVGDNIIPQMERGVRRRFPLWAAPRTEHPRQSARMAGVA